MTIKIRDKGKKEARLKRARRTRARIARLGVMRLTVYRSPRHIYAQIFTPQGERVLVQASSLESAVREMWPAGAKKTDRAERVGQVLAERARALGIERVAFDRSGFKYHGRVRALAEAARSHGLQF
ncbi:MAG: 50S ribosomal protein L18 [Gammaproteobacteria bacterium]